jgi:hypothetical protein
MLTAGEIIVLMTCASLFLPSLQKVLPPTALDLSATVPYRLRENDVPPYLLHPCGNGTAQPQALGSGIWSPQYLSIMLSHSDAVTMSSHHMDRAKGWESQKLGLNRICVIVGGRIKTFQLVPASQVVAAAS